MTDLTPESAAFPASRWSQRFWLRWGLLFVILQVAPFPLDLIPGADRLDDARTAIFDTVGPWVGRQVFGIAGEISLTQNGSGDRTIRWLELFCVTAASTALAAIWATLARSGRQERRLAVVGMLALRYTLGAVMVGYGLGKIFLLQFPFPSGDRLVQPLGEGSPMGLIWTMIGLSPAYQIFGGVAETVGGLMLFFRRTTALGAVIIVGVMTHVVLLNFCYDIPVKIGSASWLIYALVLLAPYVRPLLDVLVWHRPATPVVRPWSLVPTGRWARRALLGGKALFIGLLVYSTLAGDWEAKFGSPPDIYALYEVESFKRAGVEVPPLATDESRWRYFTLNGRGLAIIRSVGGKRRALKAKTDLEKSVLTLTPQTGDAAAMFLAFTRPAAGKLVLKGSFDGVPLEVQLRRREPGEFPMVSRGFHWINETPFNR